MATQGGGPWLAAAYGMMNAARGVHKLVRGTAEEELARATDILIHARPITSANMKAHITRILNKEALSAIARGKDPEAATYAYVEKNIREAL